MTTTCEKAHHASHKQLVLVVERSWLHVLLLWLDDVLGVEALQTRHLITCITTLLRHRFRGLLHFQCFELVLEADRMTLTGLCGL